MNNRHVKTRALSKTRILKLLLLILLATLIYFAWPVYQFYAHQGKVPMLPWGWREIPDTANYESVVADEDYQPQADAAIRLLDEHRKSIHAPGMTAAVGICSQVIWAGASGWSDIASKTPANISTRFRIGSTSKALTGTALARLVDKGTIDLDSPLKAIFAEQLPNAAWSSITPRHLASHQSGLPHYKKNTDALGLYQSVALRTRFDNPTEALAVFDSSELLFEPGSEFYYSSFGTVLLGATLEQATAKSYRQIMRSEVFEPASMNDTMESTLGEDNAHNMATFYKRSHGSNIGTRVKRWRPVDLSHRLPGGGFAATSVDLVKFGLTTLRDDYLSASARKQMWTPQLLADGTPNPQHYALGWRVQETTLRGFGKIRYANHGGVSRGAQSWLMVIPDLNMSVSINTNIKTDEFFDFSSLAPQLVELFGKHRRKINRSCSEHDN